MALDWYLEDQPSYISRGDRILSVLNGEGSVDLLPGKPDIEASAADMEKGEGYNPDLRFDPNSYSRMDKFDGLEVGQELIDSALDSKGSGSTESKTTAEGGN